MDPQRVKTQGTPSGDTSGTFSKRLSFPDHSLAPKPQADESLSRPENDEFELKVTLLPLDREVGIGV